MKQLLTLLFIGIASLYAQTVPSYVPTNGLVGWWPFNGNANDESGNNRNGTVIGAILTTDRVGTSNSAYLLNGGNQMIGTSPSHTIGGNLTVSFWVYLNSISSSWLVMQGSNQTGISYGFDNGCGLQLDGRIQQYSYNGGQSWLTSIDTLLVNNWYNVTYTLSSQGMNLYINGSLNSSNPNVTSNQNQSFYWRFGGFSHPGGTAINGKLDDIAIWNRALSLQEIQLLYNNCIDSIDLNPNNQYVNALQGPAVFVCSSSDSLSTYQWQENNGTSWLNLSSQGIYSGATSDSLMISSVSLSMNNYSYRCIVTSCTNDTSDVAVLTVSCPDSLTIQPQNFTAYSSTGWANFKCESTDTAATYQWQQNIGSGWSNLSNFGNYSGTTSDSLVIIGVTSAMNNFGYRCIVESCTTDTSDVAVLTVVNGIGVGESSLQKLTVSPNPTTGVVSLNTSVVGNYEILTLDGRILESGTAKKDYDLTNYPAGIYTLNLTTDEGIKVLKVIKN
jgi:hypothetical protein